MPESWSAQTRRIDRQRRQAAQDRAHRTKQRIRKRRMEWIEHPLRTAFRQATGKR